MNIIQVKDVLEILQAPGLLGFTANRTAQCKIRLAVLDGFYGRWLRQLAVSIVWLVSIDSSSIGSAGFCFLFSLPVIEAERFMFDSF